MKKFSFTEALAAKNVIAGAMRQEKDPLHALEDDRMRRIFKGGKIIGAGVGFLDPSDESKGAAVVLYTMKTITRQEIELLSRGITMLVQQQTVAVPTRVERSGEFHANATAAKAKGLEAGARETPGPISLDREYRRRLRPVPGGYSVGTPNGSGTAGLIVINDPGHTQLYVLSNNHVLNKDNSSGYSETIQPGGADGGRSGRDSIGRLDRFIQLSNTRDNYLDAATAIPASNANLDARYGRDRLTVPGNYTQYSVGWRLFKAGRTTEDVSGIVDSVHTDTSVNYGGYGNLGVIHFKDQSIIKQVNQPVSLPGDSGSVWLRSGDRFACALNYGGPTEGNYSISFPIEWFMTAFKCAVAGPSGVARSVSPKVDDAAKFSSAVTPKLQELLRSLVHFAQ